MIYDTIIESISGYLVNAEILDQGDIIMQEQIPTENMNLFCRFVWNFGTDDSFTNNQFIQTALLSLEFYQRKNTEYNTVYDISMQSKDLLKREIKVIRKNNQLGCLKNINVNKNTNDQDWNSYTIQLSFQIYN